MRATPVDGQQMPIGFECLGKQLQGAFAFPKRTRFSVHTGTCNRGPAELGDLSVQTEPIVFTMFDIALRPWIDPPLNATGRWLAAHGVTADQVTAAGFGIGLGAALSVALGQFGLGLALILSNRLADGLDGAIARATKPTDRGGFLDIALDFIFYASIPLAFAVSDPARNALAAATLIASFLANGGAFLAYAIVAAKRGLTTSAQGEKSMYHVAGLAEGGETIAAFCGLCLWPDAFAWVAYVFATLCMLSAIGRLLVGRRTLT